MFYRKINDRIVLILCNPYYAEKLFKLTDKNRNFLRKWLPWLDETKSVNDTKEFMSTRLKKFIKGEELNVIIQYEKRLAGIAGYNSFDQSNRIGYIGYWLGEEFIGKGIMTEVVRELIKIGKNYYNLQKIEIRCATGNIKSRAIPERLNFKHEGTLKRAEKLYETWQDHEIYGLLLN